MPRGASKKEKEGRRSLYRYNILDGPLCVVCGKEAKYRCGRCDSEYYCDKKCQLSSRKEHRKVCKPLEAKVEATMKKARGIRFAFDEIVLESKEACRVCGETMQSSARIMFYGPCSGCLAKNRRPAHLDCWKQAARTGSAQRAITDNCPDCHRPLAAGRVQLELRWQSWLRAPSYATVTRLANALRPLNPDLSLEMLRMSVFDAARLEGNKFAPRALLQAHLYADALRKEPGLELEAFNLLQDLETHFIHSKVDVHPTLRLQRSLAESCFAIQNDIAAEARYHKMYEASQQKLGKTDATSLAIAFDFGRVLIFRGKLQQGIDILQEFLVVARSQQTLTHFVTSLEGNAILQDGLIDKATFLVHAAGENIDRRLRAKECAIRYTKMSSSSSSSFPEQHKKISKVSKISTTIASGGLGDDDDDDIFSHTHSLHNLAPARTSSVSSLMQALGCTQGDNYAAAAAAPLSQNGDSQSSDGDGEEDDDDDRSRLSLVFSCSSAKAANLAPMSSFAALESLPYEFVPTTAAAAASSNTSSPSMLMNAACTSAAVTATSAVVTINPDSEFTSWSLKGVLNTLLDALL